MAVQSPPFALQNGSHNAALFRQAASSHLSGGGVIGPPAVEYGVTAQATPNMSVQVAAGRAWVPGSQVSPPSGMIFTTQAMYFVLNDAAVTVTIAAANPTNPRIDVVYVAVNDSFYSGALNTGVIGVVTGTPAASPTVPAIPNNAVALAQVAVAANATSITSGNITQVQASASALLRPRQTKYADLNPTGGIINHGTTGSAGTVQITLANPALVQVHASTFFLLQASAVAGYMQIREGGVVLNEIPNLGRRFHTQTATTGALTLDTETWLYAAAGTHTYEAFFVIDAGSTNFVFYDTPLTVREFG